MFYRISNIKDVPTELVEINKMEKPYKDETNGIMFKPFARFGIGSDSDAYSTIYRTVSEDGKMEMQFRLHGAYDVEVIRFDLTNGVYKISRHNVKSLGMSRKPNSSGLFCVKDAYRIGVGSTLAIGDVVTSRNGNCKVLLITEDAVVLSDDKNKTILIRKNDLGALEAHGIGYIDEPIDELL